MRPTPPSEWLDPMQVPDREPEELVRSWRQIVREGMEQAAWDGSVVTQVHVRRGCTQIVGELSSWGSSSMQETADLHSRLASAVQLDIIPHLFIRPASEPSDGRGPARGIGGAAVGSASSLSRLQLQDSLPVALAAPGGCTDSMQASDALRERPVANSAAPPDVLCASPAAVALGPAAPSHMVLQLLLSRPLALNEVVLARHPGGRLG